jgi:hypothetical protein
MSLTDDQVNHIINDQEETIASLKDKLLAMEDERDLAVGKGLELVQSMRRIECVATAEQAKEIARKAIDAFQGSRRVSECHQSNKNAS